MKFSHCGRLLASAGQDNIVRIWALKNAFDYFNNMRMKYNTEGIFHFFKYLNKSGVFWHFRYSICWASSVLKLKMLCNLKLMKYWESAQSFLILENFRFHVFRLGMPCNYLKIQQVPKSNKEYSTALLSLTGQWFVGFTSYGVVHL